MDPARLDREAVARRVGRIAGRLHLPFMDLTPSLRRAAAAVTPVYFSTDNHWNARGQNVAARAMADFLVAERHLPGCR